MKTLVIVMLLALCCGVAGAEVLSIDQIEKQVLQPYGGRNVEGRTCVTRAHEAEALYTANGYEWRERVHEVYGIRDGELGSKHMCVDVKVLTSLPYQLLGLEDAGNGMVWLPTLDVWSMPEP